MSKSILGRTQLNIGNINLTNIVAESIEATTSIKGDYLTASKGLATNADKKIVSTTASSAEIDFLTGATSNIQTQLNAKEPTISLTANRALISNGSGALAVSDITNTELGYLDGASSNIQTQITTNASAITTANTNIASNTSNIATNTSAISTANTNIATNATAIATNVTAIATANTAIATNATAIATNATAIAGKEPTVSLTANRALISNGSGGLAVSDITNTELGYLDGASSNIQTQITTNASAIATNATAIATNATAIAGKEPTVSLTANRALISSGSGTLAVSDITNTELDFLDGVSSNIQTQLNGKQPEIDSSNRLDATLIGVGNVDNQDFAKLTLAGDNLSATIPVMLNAPQTYLIQAGSNLAYNTSTTPPTLNATDTDTNHWDLASNVITNNNSSDVVVATTFKNKINTNSNAHIGRGLFGYSGNSGQVGLQNIGLDVNGSNYAIQQNGNGKTMINSSTGQRLDLCIDDSEALTISSSLNVGIGTNDPRSALHVQGTMNANSLGVHIGQQGNNSAIEIVAGDSDSAFIDFTKTSADKRGRIIYYLANDSMSIETNNAERIKIDSGGKVGIGNASPTCALYVDCGNGLTNNGILVRNDYVGSPANAQITFLKLGIGDTNYAQISAHTKAGDKTYLQFHTQSGAGTGNINERMRIDENGNVGIGETNPTDKLRVNGVCSATSYTTTSDDRVKHFEKPTTDCLTKIMSLKPTTYQKSNELYDASFVLADDKSNLKEGDELHLEVGFIAQEVKASIYEEFSSSVGGGDKWDYIDDDDEEEPAEKVLIEQEYTLNYNNIFVVAVGAIQELKAEIETLKERIAILEE